MHVDGTDRLIALLREQPHYVMEFMADFAGDTSDYIEMPADQDFVEFADLSPDQIGGALRVGIEGYPPDGLPSDLDLDSVDWTQVAAVLTSGSLFGSGFGDF